MYNCVPVVLGLAACCRGLGVHHKSRRLFRDQPVCVYAAHLPKQNSRAEPQTISQHLGPVSPLAGNTCKAGWLLMMRLSGC